MGIMGETDWRHGYELTHNRPLYDSLVGKKVLALAVSNDGETTLRFVAEDGELIYWTTDADCCSESWWSDAYNLNELRGGEVVAVIPLDIEKAGYGDPDDDGRTRQEHDQVYGFAIVTTKGRAVLAFRNSSNGYYGGSAHLGNPPYGDPEFVTLEGDDWSA